MNKNVVIDKYKSLPVQVRASFWFLICSFLQKGISMVTTPVFTRLLNTEEYGQFGVFNSWHGIVTILVSLNLYAGVYTQGLIKFDKDRNVFSSSLQGLTTSLIIVWTIIYMVFRSYWNSILSLTTVQMLAMLVLIWTTASFGFWAAEQRVTYSYKTLVVVTLVVSLAKPVLGIILVLNSQDKVTARILGLMIVELIGYSWMNIIQMYRGKKFFSKKYWLYALGFNLPLVPHYLSQVVLSGADRIMIKSLIGSSEAGIYNLAYSVSLIMTLFNTALMQTISPWMYKKIKDKKEREIAPIAYSTLLLIAAVNLLLILLAPEAISIFAPKSYHDAIWVIPPVAMSVFFMYCYDLFAKFAFYYERTKFIMIASVAGAGLNILLNSIFIKQFGYVAAGYTTLVCYIIYSLVHYWFMKIVCNQCCDGRYPYKTYRILMIAVPFVIAGMLLLCTYKYSLLRHGLIAVGIVCSALFRKKLVAIVSEIIKLRR